MGLKKLTEHFRIEHIVQVRNNKITIGSGYVHDLIIIENDFTVKEGTLGLNGNYLLPRYFKELTEASKTGRLKEIIESPDEYEQLHTVWTSRGGKVIKKQCENLGWPNITTDGQIMYENTFFTSRREALKRCRSEEFGHLKGMIRQRLRNSIINLGTALKYTFQCFWYTLRAYLFFGF